MNFQSLGESDFVLKYVATEGYSKESGVDAMGDEWGDFRKKFKYDVYVEPEVVT